MKREHRSGTIFDIVIVGKASQLVCCFIGKANAIFVFNPLKSAGCITSRLTLDRGDVFAQLAFLGFNNTYGDSFQKQGIIYRSGACRKLTYSNAKRSRKIKGFNILNRPAGFY